MAWAIHCARNGKGHGGAGYVPWWVPELRILEKVPTYQRVNLEKYIWHTRMLLLMEAENRSYEFEPKKKK